MPRNHRPIFTACMRPYIRFLRRTQNLEHKYLKSGESGKKAVIVITSNRGLAGGYNSNVIKLITQGGACKRRSDRFMQLVRREKMPLQRTMRLELIIQM